MELILNNEVITLPESSTLEQLLELRSIAPQGIAIGVNNRVIRRDQWSAHTLVAGDKITIIKATCGG